MTETPLDRARRAKAAADKATPGPWNVAVEFIRTVTDAEYLDAVHDKFFIAAARELVPALAADVEALTEIVRELADRLADCIPGLESPRLSFELRCNDAIRRALALVGDKP